MNKKIDDYLNDKFNRLTFIQVLDGNNPPKGWFKCDCGVEKVISCYAVFKGFTKSCGCLKKERQHSLNEKHKLSRHPLYKTWYAMTARCYSANSVGFKYYGARGIQVCEEWRVNMVQFVNWGIENGWFEGSQIDRINGDGDYEPTNCRFVTPRENNHNKKSVRFFEYKGELRPLSDWAIEAGVSINFLNNRIRRGWSMQQAIEMPIGTSFKRKNKTMFLEEFI